MGEVNILDHCASADGYGDNTPALVAAVAALPPEGGAIRLPAGRFRFASPCVIETPKPWSLVGSGRFGTTCVIDQPNHDGILVNGGSLFSAKGIGFIGGQDRAKGTYNFRVKDISTADVQDCYFRNTTGGLLSAENCNTMQIAELTGTSNKNGASGDTCLRLDRCSGTFQGIVFRAGGAQGFARGPCVKVTGPITSMHFEGNTFAGAGPTWTMGVAAVNDAGSSFVINCDGTHGRSPGDYVVLRNFLPAQYNNLWRVHSVPSPTQLRVGVTLGAGSAYQLGTIEGPTTAMHVSNETGPVNESSIASCLFEGLALATYGSVGLFMDGRHAYKLGERAPLQGWSLTGNYYDFGATGLMLHGHGEGVSPMSTIHGINIGGGHFENKYRGLHLEGVRGVNVRGFQGNAYQDAVDDYISMSADIYVRGSEDTQTRGISISDGQIGMCRFWDNAFAVRSKKAGIAFDGSNLADISMTGNQVFGRYSAICDMGGALANASRVHRANAFEVNGSL